MKKRTKTRYRVWVPVHRIYEIKAHSKNEAKKKIVNEWLLNIKTHLINGEEWIDGLSAVAESTL